MTLTDKELVALHNLADKQGGAAVDWINIADARVLTELGFARRTRGGWEITPQGLARVKGQVREAAPADQGDGVVQLPPNAHNDGQ